MTDDQSAVHGESSSSRARHHSSSSQTEERRQSSPYRSDERHRIGVDLQGRDNHTPISGDGALLPPPFHGLPTENAHEWHNYFKRYITYKRLSPVQQLELFTVLLRGPAAASFAGLDPDAQQDVEKVEKWFNNVYKFPSRQKYKVGHQLFTRKQGPNETVDEYFAAVQSLARQMDDKPSDEILRYSLIAGLRPNIAGAVIAFAKDEDDIKTVPQLHEAVRLAELMIGHTPDMSSFDTLLAEVKRLGERIDKSTIAQTNTRQSERRVSFSRSPTRSRQSPAPRSPTPERRYSSAATAATRGNFNRQPRQQQFQQQRQFQRSGQQPANQQTSSTRCNRCGRFHSFNQPCPAYNKQCNHCLKYSHFAVVCRSKLRGDPPAKAPNSQ